MGLRQSCRAGQGTSTHMTLDQALAFAIVIGMMGALHLGAPALRRRRAAVAAGRHRRRDRSAREGVLRLQRRHRHHRGERASGERRGRHVPASIERVVRKLGPYLTNVNRQVVALVGSVTVLSGFVKNIGALAMLMPIAFQFARRTGTSPSSLLMPMSFGALARRHRHPRSAPRPTSSCRACASKFSASRFTCSTSPRSAQASPYSGSCF